MNEVNIPEVKWPPKDFFKPGDRVRVETKLGVFIRVVSPKRNPFAAPEKGIVQFEGNKGTSQIWLRLLRLA